MAASLADDKEIHVYCSSFITTGWHFPFEGRGKNMFLIHNWQTWRYDVWLMLPLTPMATSRCCHLAKMLSRSDDCPITFQVAPSLYKCSLRALYKVWDKSKAFRKCSISTRVLIEETQISFLMSIKIRSKKNVLFSLWSALFSYLWHHLLNDPWHSMMQLILTAEISLCCCLDL